MSSGINTDFLIIRLLDTAYAMLEQVKTNSHLSSNNKDHLTNMFQVVDFFYKMIIIKSAKLTEYFCKDYFYF